MRIAIDASRTTVARVTGTEHYALRLIHTLIQQNSTHHITLYFRDQPPPGLFPDTDHVVYRIIPLPRLWTHLRFALELWRNRPDITFVPAHTLPLVFPGRAIVTVHDLGFKYFPQAHPAGQRYYLDWTTRYSARRACVILADSQATANDLSRFYGLSSGKIRVVYPGIDTPHLGDTDAIKQKYHLPERYFLFMGTLQPRKNIARIVRAFGQWQQINPDDDTGLVLAGGKGWLYDETWTTGVDGVSLPGYIDEADKGALYAGATALVFPTLYEGFGFPVLEAMHCGTAVIASNSSSLPELVGDAGLLVDPLDVDAISAAMDMISSDAGLRQQLRAKGQRQVAKFTWEAAAQAVLEAFELAM